MMGNTETVRETRDRLSISLSEARKVNLANRLHEAIREAMTLDDLKPVLTALVKEVIGSEEAHDPLRPTASDA